MKQRPRIESPCPLRARALPEPRRDFCTHCSKQVVNLDALSESELMDLRARGQNRLCVAYRVSPPKRSAVLAGVGMAVGLCATAPVAAADALPEAAPSTLIWETPAASAQAVDCDEEPEDETLMEIVVMGGISSPSTAHWMAPEDIEIPEISWADDEPSAAFVATPDSIQH